MLQHFDIDLWLPEVGGRVDYGSATTEMLLGMLGGTSKQERAMIRSRVRDGMGTLAQQGGRHLGGRPPYGYQLVDAGEHPNPKKRSHGQRLHRLEPDPVTSPVVRRIFEMFAAGQGLKQIAVTLTAEDIPSPSAYDRKRNPHRDPRGWAHTAVRTILRNEKYLGRAVWGKQVRHEELLDLDDVAAGYVTRQRWTDKDGWFYGPEEDHPALVDRELWNTVQARIAERSRQREKAERSPRTTSTPYLLRGLVHCGACERKMQGNRSNGILRYRCLAVQQRALPAYLADHPKTVYVREDHIVGPLDAWIATLADPEWLAATQEPDTQLEAQHQQLQAKLAELDAAMANLVAAIENGTDPGLINPRLQQLQMERDVLVRQRKKVETPDQLNPEDITRMLEELGGMASVLADATPAEKTSIYQELGLHLVYQPDEKALVATTDLSRVVRCVSEGGLEPPRP